MPDFVTFIFLFGLLLKNFLMQGLWHSNESSLWQDVFIDNEIFDLVALLYCAYKFRGISVSYR
jgi:hypothetical protein